MNRTLRDQPSAISRNASNTPYVLAAILAVAAVAALSIDVPVASHMASPWLLGDMRKLVDISEVFAHGLGVALILLTVLVLDRHSRRRLWRVAACAYGAGLLVQISKQVFPRIRPYAFDFSNQVQHSFLGFGSAFSGEKGDLSGSAIQSFPSGHAATAVGLALGLSWLYPRGRWLFCSFALLASFQRVQSSAHFVSDTLAAAAIACVWASLCCDDRLLGRCFTALERRGPRTSLDAQHASEVSPNAGVRATDERAA